MEEWVEISVLAPEGGRADAVEGEGVGVCISGRSRKAERVEEQAHNHSLQVVDKSECITFLAMGFDK